jgi:hypothetical protein
MKIQFLATSADISISLKKTSPFMPYMKIMAVQCKNYTEYINTLYGQCAEMLVLNLTEPSERLNNRLPSDTA